MTLEEAIEIGRKRYDALFQASDDVTTEIGVGLDSVNGRPVVVRIVPANKLNDVVGQITNGTAMMYDNRYTIFLSDEPSPIDGLTSLTGHWRMRYLVLHEYGHIRNGDVFEDAPESNYRLRTLAYNDSSIARSIILEQELAADGYAVHRLMSEAGDAGNHDVANALRGYAKVRQLPNPLA